MKITIELGLEDINADRLQAINALLGNAAPAVEEPKDEPAVDEPYDPDARIYGEKGEKSRRTKEEKERDEAIAERWAALWPLKDVPAKPVAELEAHLDKIEEPGFEVDDAPAQMDLEEFRAVIVKHSKTLGNAALGKIMAPHKNPKEVPADERRAYADKIAEAAEDAS